MKPVTFIKPIKKNPTPEGVLVNIRNKMINELEISAPTLKSLIDRFVSIHFGGKKLSSHHTRVNTDTDMVAPKMTIKKFFMLLHIIQISRVEIIVRVTTNQGNIHEVKELVDFASTMEDPMVFNPKDKETTD